MKNNSVVFNDNAFDLLRLIGACIVMLSHSFRHFGVEKPIWSLFFTDGSVGVIIFFAMSGFLIMPAWERSSSKSKPFFCFYWNRLVRLFPMIFVSFIIITFFNFLLIGENILTIDYLKYFIKYCIFLTGDGYGSAGLSNGIMWSFYPIIIFYFIAPFLWKIAHDWSNTKWITLILFMWLFNIFDKEIITTCKSIPLFGKYVGDGFFLCLLYEFLIGSFLYFRINWMMQLFVKRYVALYLIFFTAFFMLYNYTDLFIQVGCMHSPFLGILASPLTIFIGYSLGKIRIQTDLSFGILITHMIVIGVLKFLGVTNVIGILLTVCITPIFAFILNSLIEKPVLKLKYR